MERKWIIISDELRMNNVETYADLIGENDGIIKSYGTFIIDHKNKIVVFFLDPVLYSDTWMDELNTISQCGFYSPIIQNYKWIYSETPDLTNFI